MLTRRPWGWKRFGLERIPTPRAEGPVVGHLRAQAGPRGAAGRAETPREAAVQEGPWGTWHRAGAGTIYFEYLKMFKLLN